MKDTDNKFKLSNLNPSNRPSKRRIKVVGEGSFQRKLNYRALHNQIDKKTLKKLMEQDNRPRKAISFYRYINIDASQELRNRMYIDLFEMEVLGRIYIAREGINAQISILEERLEEFQSYIDGISFLEEIPLKIGLDNSHVAFYKLVIKIREKIVADGLPDDAIDFSQVGEHLSPEEFNRRMEDPETVVVDVRNHYESEVGHFKGAVQVDCDTFREQLPMIKDELEDKKDRQILLYCTGGVRCEKASAYLKHYGFSNVGQLYGGVINYAHEVKKKELVNNYKGKNFVFDHRLGESISDDVIAHCHQCGELCDLHTNCTNDDCHLLFIQCEKCWKKMEGCCSEKCRKVVHLPVEEQRKLRRSRQRENEDYLKVYKSRLRPRLSSSSASSATR